MVKKKKKVYSTAVLLFGILAPMPIINLFSITMYVWCIMILGMINWVLFLVISIFLLAKSKINIFKLDNTMLNWG